MKIIGWVLAVLFGLMALAAFETSIIGGLLLVFAAYFCAPPAIESMNKKLIEEGKEPVSNKVCYGTAIVLMFIGGILAAPESDSDNGNVDGTTKVQLPPSELPAEVVNAFCHMQDFSLVLNDRQKELFGTHPAEAFEVGDELISGGELVTFLEHPTDKPDDVDESIRRIGEIKRYPERTIFYILEKLWLPSGNSKFGTLYYLIEIPEVVASPAWVHSVSMWGWPDLQAKILEHSSKTLDWRDAEFSKEKDRIWPHETGISYVDAIVKDKDIYNRCN